MAETSIATQRLPLDAKRIESVGAGSCRRLDPAETNGPPTSPATPPRERLAIGWMFASFVSSDRTPSGPQIASTIISTDNSSGGRARR